MSNPQFISTFSLKTFQLCIRSDCQREMLETNSITPSKSNVTLLFHETHRHVAQLQQFYSILNISIPSIYIAVYKYTPVPYYGFKHKIINVGSNLKCKKTANISSVVKGKCFAFTTIHNQYHSLPFTLIPCRKRTNDFLNYTLLLHNS